MGSRNGNQTLFDSIYFTSYRLDGLQGDDQQSRIVDQPSSSSRTSSPHWLIGAVVGGAVGALLLVIGAVVLVMRSRRISGSSGSRRPKPGRHQDQLAEDSDVRYLRDEDDVQLDLTEATPSPLGRSPQRQFTDFERL